MGKIKELGLDQQQRAAFLKEQLKGTKAFRATQKKQDLRQEVDKENGCIYGVSVCTAGEALGHCCWLDADFISNVTQLGNKNIAGLKARFGHPSMSGEALGTYLGRFRNFRQEGSQTFADLYFDEIAKDSPNGDLYAYCLGLAESDPEAFGTSIVFSPEGYYYKKEGSGENISGDDHYSNVENDKADYELEKDAEGYAKTYVSIKELYGCDMVDEPAANPSGLFSSTQFNQDKFAVIATQFLNANPKISDFLLKSPHKLIEFLTRYQSMLSPITAENMPEDAPEDEKIVTPNRDEDESIKAVDAPIESVKEDASVVAESNEAALQKVFEKGMSDLKTLFQEGVDGLKKDIQSLDKRVTDMETNPSDTPLSIKPVGDATLGKAKEESSWVKSARAKLPK